MSSNYETPEEKIKRLMAESIRKPTKLDTDDRQASIHTGNGSFVNYATHGSTIINGPSPKNLTSPSLISCPDCGNTVSKRSEACPHCGLNVKEHFVRLHREQARGRLVKGALIGVSIAAVGYAAVHYLPDRLSFIGLPMMLIGLFLAAAMLKAAE